MLGKTYIPKYLDLGSPIINACIKKKIIQNSTLICLRASINVMTGDTMLELNLRGSLRHTPTIYNWLIGLLVS